jgi:nitrate/TMAO reductase-like tetraheme cytochrome c subunit
MLLNRNNLSLCSIWLLLLIVAGCAEIDAFLSEPSPYYTTETEKCINCHSRKGISMSAVRDWKLSLHAAKKVGCERCHIPVEAASEVLATESACKDKNVRRLVSRQNCLTSRCHEKQGKQFEKSKHAHAWDVIASMVESHELPGDEQGCESCHRIGKDEGKCDSCHTKHRFSAAWARRPETCETCHRGAEHPETETYMSSKHGSVYRLESHTWNWSKKIRDWHNGGSFSIWPGPRTAVCVTCHMARGNHAITTSWGILAAPLVLIDGDEEWFGYRKTILKGVGVLFEEGKPTGRQDIIDTGLMSELTRVEWFGRRQAMLGICKQCHTKTYVTETFEGADVIMKASDALMAEAVSIVEELYNSDVLSRKKPFPAHGDILHFYQADTQIEQLLYEMLLNHRKRNFQGIYHFMPEYLQGYGLRELKIELEKIKSEAKKLRGGEVER